MPEVLPDYRGCYHKSRPMSKRCSNCGSSLCYECVIKEVVDIVKYTDSVLDKFENFCAACYLERINKPGYKIMYAHSTSWNPIKIRPKKPNLLNPFSFGGSIVMLIISIVTIPLIMGIFTFFMFYYSPYRAAVKKYKEYQNKRELAITITDEVKKLNALPQ